MLQCIIRLKHINKLFILNFLCSRLRNQNNILHSIRENYISHTTTTQYKLFVRENGTHTYRTGSLVNNTTYSVNLTFFSIHCTVSQFQFYSRHLLQLFFQCATGSCQTQQLLFSHREIHIHFTDFTHGSQRLCYRRTHQTTNTIRECTHHSI